MVYNLTFGSGPPGDGPAGRTAITALSHAETTAADRRRVVGFLRQLDRRLRLNDSLRLATRGMWIFAGVLVFLRISGLWSPPALRWSLVGVYIAGWLGYALWEFRRQQSFTRPAAVADDRASLADELKSALAFLGLEERSDWMALQVHRAAEKTERLDAEELEPTVVPRHLYLASGLGITLLAVLLWDPSWLARPEFLAWDRGSSESGSSESVFGQEEEEAALEELALLQELEEQREQLRAEDVSLSASLRDLEEAQQALADAAVDADRLQEGLQQMGEQLESTASLAELAEALKSQSPEEAAELMRELAKRLGQAQTPEELQALLEALQNASSLENADMDELLQNLENAAAGLSEKDLAEAMAQLQDAAQQLEAMSDQMASAEQMQGGQPGQEGQEGQEAMQSAMEGASQQGANAEQSQMQAMQGGAAALSSNQVQMAQLGGNLENAVPLDAGPSGHSTGEGGEEAVLGEATRLDVQLEMEMLSTEEQEEPIPEEIFERQSREEKSTLSYEQVRQRRSYAEEDVMTAERIPWQYRSLMRSYFMSLRDYQKPEEKQPEQ